MKNVIGRNVVPESPQGKPLGVMHIILNLDIGGAQEVVRTLVKYMIREGHRPIVCTFKDGPLRQEIEQLGVPVEILPDRRYSILTPHRFALEMFRIRKELILLIRKHQVQVIQTHLLQSLDFLAATLRFMPLAPSIYWTVHNYNFTLRSEDLPRFHWLLRPKQIVYRLLWHLLIHWIDGVIAVSEEVQDAILKNIGSITENKITVISNGVDLERYREPIDKQLIRKTLGLAEDAKLLLVVAMLREQKGHHYLIEAASRVVPQFPDLHILIVGDGVLKEDLIAQTKHLGLQEYVHFLGIRDDIPRLLAGSDTFVLPSLWEGLPMSLIEAMASALPIVATEVSGSKQVMVSGVTGLLVPPGDSQRLAEAILEVISHPQWGTEMGRAAQERVEKEYSAVKQVREHITLYHQKDQMTGQPQFERDLPESI